MARVVIGDRTVMNAMLFGGPPPMLQDYMQQSQQHFLGTLNDVGRQFAETAQHTFAQLDASEAMRLAKAAFRTINVYGLTDIIQPLYTEERIRTAPQCMIPYIMACPEITSLYNEGVIDGYNDRYTPVTKTIPMGWENPYYAQVMNGQMILTNEDEEDERVEYTYTLDEDEFKDLNPLESDEAYEILNTWDHIRSYIKQRKDVTSIYESNIP